MDSEVPFVDIAHNNEAHISIVVIHIWIIDMQTLLPLQCHMQLETYDLHVSRQNFYMFQINDFPFHQTFYFLH